MPCSLAGHGGGVTANRCCAAAPVVQLSARCLHPSRKAKLPALRRRSRVLALAAQAVLCFVHHKRPRSQYGAAAPRFDAASQFLQSWVLADTVGLRSRLAPNCVMLGAPLFAADSPNGHSPTVIQGVDAAIQQRLFRCAVPSQVVLAIHDASVPPDEPGALYVYYSALSPHNVVHDWFQARRAASLINCWLQAPSGPTVQPPPVLARNSVTLRMRVESAYSLHHAVDRWRCVAAQHPTAHHAFSIQSPRQHQNQHANRSQRRRVRCVPRAWPSPTPPALASSSL